VSVIFRFCAVIGGWLIVTVAPVFAQATGRVLSCGGPFGPEMHYLTLVKAFGASNVKTESIYVGEGFFEGGIVLFGSSPEDRLEILERQWGPKRGHVISVRGAKSNWRTPEGLMLGMRLRAVERLNGRAFRLLGFDWDHGGRTMSWSGGEGEFSSGHPAMQAIDPIVDEVFLIQYKR
jgi:hypothetical protein